MSHSSRRKNTQAMYQAVRKEYRRLAVKDPKTGVQKYSNEHIIRLLSEQFFRAPATIERILFRLSSEE